VAGNPFSKFAKLMFLITWLIVFALMVFLFNRWETKKEAGIVHSSLSHQQLTIAGDKRGHYQFKGKVNGREVTFIIDTGASAVAIPAQLALSMGLTKYYPVALKTANGEVTGHLTRLKSLEMGPIKLKNVGAVIMPGDGSDKVLIGMNVLSELEMSQANNQLTIKQK